MKRIFLRCSVSFTQLIRKTRLLYVIHVARRVRSSMQMVRGINGRRKTRKKLGEDERKDEKRTVGLGSAGRKVVEFDTGG